MTHDKDGKVYEVRAVPGAARDLSLLCAFVLGGRKALSDRSRDVDGTSVRRARASRLVGLCCAAGSLASIVVAVSQTRFCPLAGAGILAFLLLSGLSGVLVGYSSAVEGVARDVDADPFPYSLSPIADDAPKNA